MNGKVYTLQDVKELFEIAKQEYTEGWWGIVVPEYLYDQLLAETEMVDSALRSLFTINVIINDEIVKWNGGHCMFVDKEFGKMLLDMYTLPYNIYEKFVFDEDCYVN